MFSLTGLFNAFHTKPEKILLQKDQIAELLKTTPEALDAFEESYARYIRLEDPSVHDMLRTPRNSTADTDAMIDRIVDELIADTMTITVKDDAVQYTQALPYNEPYVTVHDLDIFDTANRPQLTGSLIHKDVEDNSSDMLLMNWYEYLHNPDPAKKQMHYHMFRQGLDMLDLDGITYAILGMNPNSIGHWLPALAKANGKHKFFRIPDTTVIRVPLPILQLTRLCYESLTDTSKEIVNRFCERVFGLDPAKDYFVKTGTYSSKFDFRNAHVTAGKEVHELGEYLLYIQYQASSMAHPTNQPCIYGVSTTNEWAVRDYVPNTEHLPTIYKGLPLRTEYRVFIDFDTDEILGMSPYWRPDLMKQRFAHEDDAGSPHQIHDYIIYRAEEERLQSTYKANKDLIAEKLMELIPDMWLTGQWSLDIMQDENDFYLIDMALAQNSALLDCVPEDRLRTAEEDWMPRIPDLS